MWYAYLADKWLQLRASRAMACLSSPVKPTGSHGGGAWLWRARNRLSFRPLMLSAFRVRQKALLERGAYP